MRFAVLAAAMIAAVAEAAGLDLGGGMEFAAALVETDMPRRAEMLLNAAERDGYPADLALVYLVRTPLPRGLSPRIVALAQRRRGKVIPALLAMRVTGGANAPAREAALEAWLAAAERGDENRDPGLFRELSGLVLDIARTSAAAARIRPELEKLILRHPKSWRRHLPPVAVLVFYYDCAFRASGFEPASPKWADSPHPECRAFVRLAEELRGHVPDNGPEAEALIRLIIATGEEQTALALAAEFARRHPSQAALELLIFAATEAGAVDVFDSFRELINPEALPVLKFYACLRSGDFAKAEKLLLDVAPPELRSQLKLKLFSAKGDLRESAKMALLRSSGIPPRERIMTLLSAAEFHGEAKYYREAEKLMSPEAWKDPVLANAFGFVALELGMDPAAAEKLIRAAVEMEPENSAYLDSMAVARAKSGDRAGAWEWMARALEHLPPHPSSCEILEHAGDIRQALGDREQAQKFRRAALRLAELGGAKPDGANYRRVAERIRSKLEAKQ